MKLLDLQPATNSSTVALLQGGSLRSVALAATPETDGQTDRLRELGTQAAKIAHDLNNVLSPILMALDLVRPQLKEKSALTMIDLAKKSALRAADLASQILSFARGAEQQRSAVDSAAVLEEIASHARETFPKSLGIEAVIPGDLAKVAANATQLHQVLLNLCVNARDAMPEGGTLSVSAANVEVPASPAPSCGARPGSYVLFEVSDTGSGIPEAIRERIFDPFFTTKAPGKGTGLGLASVRSIVEKHGGVLTLRTETGHGTTFRILLPAA